jgi:hypothetical protein
LEEPTEAEKRVMADMLQGARAPETRQKGCLLMLAAAAHVGKTDTARVRFAMAGAPSNFSPPDDVRQTWRAWRRVQVRQVFRLALESLLYWLLNQLAYGPRSSAALVEAFLATTHFDGALPAKSWLSRPHIEVQNPTTLLATLEDRLQQGKTTDLSAAISDALAFSISEAPDEPESFERHDRLPLARARKEALAWGNVPTNEFLRHVFESWVLAQHLYWAVGRGLADARSGGKRILRVRAVLDEQGWTLAPGASTTSQPAASEDRLRTALTLAEECDLL